ncbi:4Fe-4S binding protein [Methanocaldococcus indicus]|uniref:4Fe-4S binding protein n=1 Tax=Methanocaldococcus indicus TaxID=213231 RepID=UPI003C6D0B61
MKIKDIIKYLFFNDNKNFSKTKKVELNNCIGCGLCVKVCQTEAITIFKFRSYICECCGICVEICPAINKNRFDINEELCKKCGICALFCPIPVIKNEIPKPKTPVILKDRCKNCGLCYCKYREEGKCKLCLECIEKCPNQAILSPKEFIDRCIIKVDVDSCIFCYDCEEVCPIK